MGKKLEISSEEVKFIINVLNDWVSKPESYVFAQFLGSFGMGWTAFQDIIKASADLQNAFDCVISRLCSRWIEYAFSSPEGIPKHMQNVLMKYLRVYDNHAFSVEMDNKNQNSVDFRKGKHEQRKFSTAEVEDIFKESFKAKGH